MIALQFTEIKPFMNKLLASDMFHHFLLSEATIVNGVTYSIDGHISRKDETELCEDYPHALASYEKMQSHIYDMIKGTHTPSYMKFVFCLSPENVAKTLASVGSSLHPEDLSGMYINLTYQNDQILATTGVSYSIFTKDKTLEQEWDRLVRVFFTKNELNFELLS